MHVCVCEGGDGGMREWMSGVREGEREGKREGGREGERGGGRNRSKLKWSGVVWCGVGVCMKGNTTYM